MEVFYIVIKLYLYRKGRDLMLQVSRTNNLKVSKTQENIILDEIGLYLKKERKYDYGIINDKKILNYVVD